MSDETPDEVAADEEVQELDEADLVEPASLHERMDPGAQVQIVVQSRKLTGQCEPRLHRLGGR